MSDFRAAVLGKPIEHSLSPVLHNAGYTALGLSNWQYDRIECDESDLAQVLSNSSNQYRGFSVTMPGKFQALALADEATERARLIGSANTLVRRNETSWVADNTDCDGIIGAINVLFNRDDANKKRFSASEYAVIIGAGGTARPAVWAVAQLGVKRVIIVNRSDRSLEFDSLAQFLGVNLEFRGFDTALAEICAKAAVIISTVPSVGIPDYVPIIAQAPIIDVIYDPWPTLLVETAHRNGISAVGGHVMLAHQAYGQFEQFTGYAAPRDAMWLALCRALGISV
ncbi:shikimate-5-dehydrogenase, fungal AROM-type [Corynebacterium mustelae]|uniref:shikimate dehydrogenase (NADP(+)) n=1 Tax=Corynebacterium mustelae TaxID=571915 RepID=A0A0G3GZS1_9CORY|nr:shikimate dehydrogenase [Corynebacterium mustelae]AKK06045.1 shikimate-5-dehydrogenase, fungal AROM-type [Corynebacterium mustelae]